MENQELRPLLVSFVASRLGPRRIDRIDPIVGETLPNAERLEIVESPSVSSLPEPNWVLRGITSKLRYTNQLVLRLRDTKEWKYVDREIDIRLVRS